MKNIKFRQKLNADYVKGYGGQFHFWGYGGELKGFVSPLSVNHSSFESQQFTGFKDKNGVDIYEGDILAYGEHVPERAVIFENGSFRLCDNTFSTNQSMVVDTVKRLEIVGNIHENPELLKDIS